MGNKLLLWWTKLFIELTLIEMLKGNVEKDDGVKTSLYNSNSINLIIIIRYHC